jgi:methylaspartate mutase sigma subunit
VTHHRMAGPVAHRPVVTVPFAGHLVGREHHVPRQNGRAVPGATQPGLAAAIPNRRLHVVVTSVSSDAHTWNLVYLQLLLEELGCQVTNLGACTPDETIVTRCAASRPDLIVVSSLNGHGARDGIRLIDAVRSCPALVTTPVVIGGKLDLTGGGDDRIAARLLAAGFDAVFGDSGELVGLRSLVRALAVGAGAPIGAE